MKAPPSGSTRFLSPPCPEGEGAATGRKAAKARPGARVLAPGPAKSGGGGTRRRHGPPRSGRKASPRPPSRPGSRPRATAWRPTRCSANSRPTVGEVSVGCPRPRGGNALGRSSPPRGATVDGPGGPSSPNFSAGVGGAVEARAFNPRPRARRGPRRGRPRKENVAPRRPFGCRERPVRHQDDGREGPRPVGRDPAPAQRTGGS